MLLDKGQTPSECGSGREDQAAAGNKLIPSAMEEHAAAMKRAAPGLTAVERARVVALLKKLGLEAQHLLR